MTVRSTRFLALALLTAVLTGGCGGSDRHDGADSAGHGQQIAVATDGGLSVPVQAGAAVAGFPTCDEVKAALGPAVDGLVAPAPARRGTGVTLGVDGPSLACSWHTEQAASGDAGFVQGGGISVRISRDLEYTPEDVQRSGATAHDGRVASVGAWAFKVGGAYEPSERLDQSGVQVVRDGVVVALTSDGPPSAVVPQLASLTNRWALERGVALLELMA